MAAITPLLLQLIPVLVPYVMQLFDDLLSAIGQKVPDKAKPVLNAALGAVVGQLTTGNPGTGALVAHVMRSGLVHEPAQPKA